MVKKSSKFLIPYILLIAFVLLLLGGCSDLFGASGTSAGKIIPPSDSTCPFPGKWTVLEELGLDEDPESTESQWEGKSMQFAEDCVAIDDAVWTNISYKIKRVDAADYLELKLVSYSDLILEKQQVEVVTVYADGNYLGEAMRADDSGMVFFAQDRGLLLIKVSDVADLALDSSVSEEQNLIQDGSQRTSGILLGLRIPEEIGYTYYTLWIAADQGKVHPVLISEGLFFPRTSGFWELHVQNITIEDVTGNLLSARNVTERVLKAENEDIIANGATEDLVEIDASEKIVTYIGNDYIALEKKDNDVSRLMVLPVDNLSSSTEIKLSDLVDQKSRDSLFNAWEHEVNTLSDKGIRLLERNDFDKNFGLKRKNGHWTLVGRINYYQNGGTPTYTDFDIKIVPSVSLVSYDTLVLSWPKIKDRVPDALDAFTSPNKDIALVQTKNKLSVYKIGAEQLSENPSVEFDMPENATVIMAEWAIGSYVESWGNSFLSYGARVLDEDSVRMH
jgi:hypothetical protein